MSGQSFLRHKYRMKDATERPKKKFFFTVILLSVSFFHSFLLVCFVFFHSILLVRFFLSLCFVCPFPSFTLLYLSVLSLTKLNLSISFFHSTLLVHFFLSLYFICPFLSLTLLHLSVFFFHSALFVHLFLYSRTLTYRIRVEKGHGSP